MLFYHQEIFMKMDQELNKIYSNGEGVEQDYLKAKEYYELSSKYGNSNALVFLGMLYEYGIPKDYLKAKFIMSYQQNKTIQWL